MKYYDIHTHCVAVDPEVIPIVNTIVEPDGRLSEETIAGRSFYRSAGIHPWQIGDAECQLDTLKRLAFRSEYVAIGEAGLDKRKGAPLPAQLDVFEAQVRLAEECGKPLLVHCVKAWPELMATKKRWLPAQPWIIHGFRGNGILAGQLVRQGFRLSFGLFFHPEAARAAWPDCLFAETDEAAETGIREVYARLAAALQLPLASLASQITANVGLFGLGE